MPLYNSLKPLYAHVNITINYQVRPDICTQRLAKIVYMRLADIIKFDESFCLVGCSCGLTVTIYWDSIVLVN